MTHYLPSMATFRLVRGMVDTGQSTAEAAVRRRVSSDVQYAAHRVVWQYRAYWPILDLLRRGSAV